VLVNSGLGDAEPERRTDYTCRTCGAFWSEGRLQLAGSLAGPGCCQECGYEPWGQEQPRITSSDEIGGWW
jgi:hypothetical protein